MNSKKLTGDQRRRKGTIFEWRYSSDVKALALHSVETGLTKHLIKFPENTRG